MPQTSRNRPQPVDNVESENDLPQDDPVSDGYGDGGTGANAERDLKEELARKLVRYALSCEYGRKPIKRQDINQKILGTNSRQFNNVFREAQFMLQTTFGMEMVELPKQEKLTLAQKRAAANKADKPVSSSTGNYILLTTLDYKYRTPEIISPPRVPNVFHESTYVGLYSFIVAMIYISGGSLQEETFYRHMRRMNADKNTPIETTEKLVQTMLNDGYLSKSKDNSTGEELVEYHVGPRGKVEIGEEGVARIVKTIYGDAADEDLIKRLEKTLALSSAMKRPEPGPAAAGAAHPKKRKRPSRQQGKESDDAQEESGEEAEESEDE